MDSANINVQHILLKQRMDSIHTDIAKTSNLIYKTDMLKMYKNINDIWAKLDTEMVTCRVRQKLTPKYDTLSKQINERLSYLEKNIMWARLM